MQLQSQKIKLIPLLKSAYALLKPRDRRRLALVTFVQIATGFLDLLAVGFIGLLTTLAMQPDLATSRGSKVYFVLHALHISSQKVTVQIFILGLVAVLLFTIRTIASVWLSRLILFSLGKWAAKESSNLIGKFLSQDLIYIQSKNIQETLYSVTFGVESLSVRFLAVASNILADSVILAILGIGLTVLDPIVAVSTVIMFSIIGFGLYKFMHQKANTLGHEFSNLTVLGNAKFIDITSLFREIVIRNSRKYFIRELSEIRSQLSNTLAEMAFLPNVSKYLIEAVVVVAALLISGIQFLLHDSLHAISTLAIFMAAGTRIAPSALRVQQGFLLMLNNIGPSQRTIELSKELNARSFDSLESAASHGFDPFQSSISIRDLYLTYPGGLKPILNGIDLDISPGQFVAIVGPSGSGKTSLVDVVLGLKRATQGVVKLSGVHPSQAVARWPGAIAYVPQEVTITAGTLRENIELGFGTKMSDQELYELLSMVALGDLLSSLADGLETKIGDGGVKLSGGERQRLGIARALYTKPNLIFLDEATSALDAETEDLIASAIRSLKGSVTLVVIAHRLSTVRDADLVIYLSDGDIKAQGTFNEVRRLSLDFDNQAGLMGL